MRINLKYSNKTTRRGALGLLLMALMVGFNLMGPGVFAQQEAPMLPSSGRSVVSLDGSWQIVYDRHNQGRKQEWVQPGGFPMEQIRQIDVPACWERVEKDYEGVAFYRRTFDVPENWKGKCVRLQFDAVNYRAEVWVNHTAVGFHDGGYTPFEFEVDDVLNYEEENTLILRVVGPILMKDRIIDGIGKMETPQWRGAIAGGIWQPVRLVTTDDMYVDDVYIEPKISNNTARFNLDIRNVGERTVPAQVEVIVQPEEAKDHPAARMKKSWKLKPGSNKKSWTLEIDDAQYWSPDHPFLYQAQVRVRRNGRISDTWQTRFGMREFTIRDNQFYLNGQPIYLKATFFEGLYPNKLAYPDSREMAIREIKLAKQAGFNMIRPWRKPPPPMWLDLADSLGVMTVGSPAVECMDFPYESAQLAHWIEKEIRETILRDRNRACIVQWELFNEIKRPVLERLLHPMTVVAQSLDSTRLILDESGGWARGANMYLPYEREPYKFNDIHDYPGPMIHAGVYKKLILAGRRTHKQMREMGLTGRLPGKNVVPGLMTYFSELGYGSLPNLVENNETFAEKGNPLVPAAEYHRRLADQHRQVLEESGFDRIYPDLEQFCRGTQQIHGRANKRMIEAVRVNPNVKGYCVHALTAGDWIMGAGLLDLWRNPKEYVYQQTKEANQPRLVSIRVRPRNVYGGNPTRIAIKGVNEKEPFGGQLEVQVKDRNGEIVFQDEKQVNLDARINELYEHTLDTKSLEGHYRVVARLVNDQGRQITLNDFPFHVFDREELVVPETDLALLDPDQVLKPFLEEKGMTFKDFDANTPLSLPVLVTRTHAGNPTEQQRFDELKRFIRQGGRAVYMNQGGWNAPFGQAGPAPAVLPFDARIKQARGNWNAVPHIVTDHPIFEGLPVDQMMGPVYENVWGKTTLFGLEGETVVGSIGYDWFPDYDRKKRHYIGPGDTWWGKDMAILPVDKGYCIVTTMRLIQNLGKDPVAERIFYNMIEYLTNYTANTNKSINHVKP